MTLIDAVGVSGGGNLTILRSILGDSELDRVTVVGDESLKVILGGDVRFVTVPKFLCARWSRIIWQQLLVQVLGKKLKVDSILSLSNMCARYTLVKTTVYFHQSLLFPSKKDIEQLFSFKSRVSFWLQKRLFFLSAAGADRIVVQTKTIQKRISSEVAYASNKLLVHNPPVRQDYILSEAVISKESRLSLLYFAYPAEYKNYGLLVETAVSLRSKCIEDVIFRLTIPNCTKGLDKRMKNLVAKIHRSITENGVESYFEYIGFISSDTTKMAAMAKADIILHISLQESFPITILEASYLNKTLVSVDLPYARDILEGYSYFVSDASELSDMLGENRINLNRFCSHELYNSIINRYSWREIVQ